MPEIQKVAVVGAGTMGNGIVHVFAQAGFGVTMIDVRAEALEGARKTIAGIMLAVAYLKTRSLWFATAVHLGWNWTMQSLLGFPVSGLNEFDTPLYDVRELGPDAVTGGAFGPEAGVAATLAIAAGTLWMWRTRRLRESARMVALRPLVDTRLGPGGGL